MAKNKPGKVLKRRSKWTPRQVELLIKKREKAEEKNIIDQLAAIFYSFAVNQSIYVQKDLSLKASVKNQEAV